MAIGAKVPLAVWAELAQSPEEAEQLAYEAYRQRREARISARLGFE